MPSAEYMERKSERARESSRKAAKRAADIGALHAVQNPKRRHLCQRNLGLWLQTYYPASTGLGPFSLAHYQVIDSLENCLLYGGWYANAVYREFAKTSIAEGAAQWALAYGHRRFGAIFGADEGAAQEITESILMDFRENDMLWEDFPEICVAFRHLEGRHQRCASQEFEGSLTHIHCVGARIVLPSIRLSKEQSKELGIPINADGWTLSSGGIIEARGLLSASRGMKHKRPDGTQQRPDFGIIDDPLTDRAADSPADIAKRLKTIRKAIIPLAGQRRKLALICNGTTIEDADIMCQLLDARISPGWSGRRIPMLLSRSKNEDLWNEYGRLLMTWDREVGQVAQTAARLRALEYYKANRRAMDEGAEATWHTCYSKDQHEISAIQHAYNVLFEQGEEVFASEAQQNPRRRAANAETLKSNDVISKANELARRMVPTWANMVNIMVDVQDDALYWLALACGDGFSTHVLDYEIFPEQPGGSLAYGRVKKRLRDMYPGNMEAALLAGLKALFAELKTKVWTREDGVQLSATLIAGDSGDNSTVVYGATSVSKCIPTKGRYVGATSVQWEDFPKRDGEEISRQFHWLMAPTKSSGTNRVLSFDANWWKTFVTRRLKTAIGDPGSLTLFGSPGDHVEFAEHVLAEYGVVAETRKAKVEEWKLRPGRDNHLFDCLVGAHVLCAKAGATLKGLEPQRLKSPQRTKQIEATYF